MVKVTLAYSSRATKRKLKSREFSGSDHISALIAMADFLCKNPSIFGAKMDIIEKKEEDNA